MRLHLALLVLLIVVPAVRAELRAGAAAVVITPPVGTPMAGYYSARAADGTLDDLFARALVLDDGTTKAAIVALDLISTTRPMVEEARKLVAAKTGIPAANVMITATHAHTGPVLSGRGLRDNFLGGGTDLVRRYGEELPVKVAEAVAKADAALTPVRVRAGHGKEDSIAFNRRFRMKDGSVAWNPALLSPEIVEPLGPIDPDVPVIRFETPKGEVRVISVNHAVHLDCVGGTKFSADMPATLIRLLREVHGPNCEVVYTTGCCGDVNHRNVQWGDPQKGPKQAARMGVALAAEVLRAEPKLRPAGEGRLRCQSVVVKLPLVALKDGDLERANEVVKRFEKKAADAPKFLETVDAFKILDVSARKGEPHAVEVQVITLGGDVAWVSLPGEIFVELGLDIKKRSPFAHTTIAELANGSVGYIPTKRAYAEGNYEPVSARVAEGSGEMLVEAALKLLAAAKE